MELEHRGLRLGCKAVVALMAALVLPASAAASGITNAGGDARNGWYPNQPQLRPGAAFGQLWSTPVDGQVYAQPLVAGSRVIVATERNRVTSLNLATGRPQWKRTLGTPWNPSDLNCSDLTPSIGVTSTPVIDPASNTVYLTHKTYMSGHSGPAAWYLDALDLGSGAQRPGFPVRLDGVADNDPARAFNPTMQLQRTGLLLLDGVIYLGFGSHCGLKPYQGWIFGVSTAGQVRARWVANTVGDGSGIWQTGTGLMSDGPGRLFVTTGNGWSPPPPTAGNGDTGGRYGGSVVHLDVQPDGTLKPVDFFAPYDAAFKDLFNGDFSSGGVAALPDAPFGTPGHPHVAVAAGKPGYVYVLDRDHLGGIAQGPAGLDDVLNVNGPIGAVFSRVGVWPGDGGYVYVPTATNDITWLPDEQGRLHVFAAARTADGRPALKPAGTAAGPFGFGSGAPVITSDGTRSGSALVWSIWMGGPTGEGAELRAYNPVPRNGALSLRFRAPIGTGSKFSTPGVGGGRVLVGTRDGHVLAFGVRPPRVAAHLKLARPRVSAHGRRLTVRGSLTRRASGSLTVTVRLLGTARHHAVTTRRHARIRAGRFSLVMHVPAARRLRVTVSWPGSVAVKPARRTATVTVR